MVGSLLPVVAVLRLGEITTVIQALLKAGLIPILIVEFQYVTKKLWQLHFSHLSTAFGGPAKFRSHKM